ncbi:MAG: thiamine pyrophosphate-binding protein, partial [Pseudomonadota bacterium]
MADGTAQATRTAAALLVDALALQGVDTVFGVPGESYLAVLDALHDTSIRFVPNRHEAGAAYMAEAWGKLTGRPGICFVTRGPGATHAAIGVHAAMQASTPMLLFVGQVARSMRWREAFQELDYAQVFGGLAKWAAEIDDPARVPEMVARAFATALGGRPGPVVLALPEDMLVQQTAAPPLERAVVAAPPPADPADAAAAARALV